MLGTRDAKINAWFFALCAFCIVGGALGVSFVSDPAGDARLLLVSGLALLAGVFSFLLYLVVHLWRKGIKPLTGEEQEVQKQVGGAIGRAAAHALLGKFLQPAAGSKAPRMVNGVLAGLVGAFVGGSAAAGIAALLVQRSGIVFWVLVSLGVIIGVGYGVWAFDERSREAARQSEARSQVGEVSGQEASASPSGQNPVSPS